MNTFQSAIRAVMVLAITLSCMTGAMGQQTKQGQQTDLQKYIQTKAPHPFPGKPNIVTLGNQMFPYDTATGTFVLPPKEQAQVDKMNKVAALSQAGNKAAKDGDWPKAEGDYQQALSLDPHEIVSLYALGNHAEAQGDLPLAIAFYRQAVYAHPAPNPPMMPQFAEWNPYRLMEYALMLSKTGHQNEAQRAYLAGAKILNETNEPCNDCPLPSFGNGPDQVAFTPQHLQALADAGWAADHWDYNKAKAKARLQEALTLYPDSPIPYFYQAIYEARFNYDYKAMAADLDKAEQFGNETTEPGVRWIRNMFQINLASAAATTTTTPTQAASTVSTH